MTLFSCEACGGGPLTTGVTVYRMESTGAYRCIDCANEPIPEKTLAAAASYERAAGIGTQGG